MNETIYFAMEFYGTGDPFFGGSAADWCLYTTEDGGQAFISTPEANRPARSSLAANPARSASVARRSVPCRNLRCRSRRGDRAPSHARRHSR